MSDFIVDPTDRTQAIHAPTGGIAGRVFIGLPPDDLVRPTLAELDNMTFVGFTDPVFKGKP